MMEDENQPTDDANLNGQVECRARNGGHWCDECERDFVDAGALSLHHTSCLYQNGPYLHKFVYIVFYIYLYV